MNYFHAETHLYIYEPNHQWNDIVSIKGKDNDAIRYMFPMIPMKANFSETTVTT